MMKAKILFFLFMNLTLVRIGYSQPNSANSNSIFSFPKNEVCLRESSVTKINTRTKLKGIVGGVLNDMVLETTFTNKYEYNSQKQLVRILSNVQNLPDAAKKGVKGIISEKLFEILGSENNAGNEKESDKMKGAIDSSNIKIQNLVVEIQYNSKGQIASVNMPTSFGMQVEDVKMMLTSNINITYDDEGKIVSMIELSKGNMKDNNRNDSFSLETITRVEYISNLSFKSTSETKSGGKILKTSEANFVFDKTGNVVKTNYIEKNPDGKIQRNNETNYEEYYSDLNSPVDFANFQFITALRSGSGTYGYISTNCLKKSTFNDSISNKVTSVTIENVVSEKCCIKNYTLNSNSGVESETREVNSIEYKPGTSGCKCESMTIADLNRIVEGSFTKLDATTGKIKTNFHVDKGDYVYVGAKGTITIGKYKTPDNKLHVVKALPRGPISYKANFPESNMPPQFKKIYSTYRLAQLMCIIGDKIYPFESFFMNDDCDWTPNKTGLALIFSGENLNYFIADNSGNLEFQLNEVNYQDNSGSFDIEIYILKPDEHKNRNCFNRCPKIQPEKETGFKDKYSNIWDPGFWYDEHLEKCYHCSFKDFRGKTNSPAYSDKNVLGCQCVYNNISPHELVNVSSTRNGHTNCLGSFDYGNSQAAIRLHKEGFRMHFILDIAPHSLLTPDNSNSFYMPTPATNLY